MQHLKLISQLRKCFARDSVSLFYHGTFDDTYTDKFINIVEIDANKKIRGKLAFVMAESFQNVVRHKDDTLSESNHNLFGIRGIDDHMHIFSSNLVSKDVMADLENMISGINALDKDGLKQRYMEILETGELSEKGGAGMGLIEMARRSTNPLQFEFVDQEDAHAFNMQVDFDRIKGGSTKPPMDIEENSYLVDLIYDDSILFIYHGEFSDEVLQPMIPIVENNTEGSGPEGFAIFHVAIELMQNIGRHGKLDENGRKMGLFALKKIPGGYYVCSGNYTDADTSSLQNDINDLNLMQEDELNELYKKGLKESVTTDINSAKVGMIDIRRTSKNFIDVKVSEDAKGNYVMLGTKIMSNGGN